MVSLLVSWVVNEANALESLLDWSAFVKNNLTYGAVPSSSV
jgi:hypothetical protein